MRNILLSKQNQMIGVRGFTLVEILLYSALLVILTGVMVTSMFSLHHAFEKNRTERALTHAATVVFERIVRETRFANYIHEAQSSFDVPNGILVLGQIDKTIHFYIAGGAVVIAENGVDIGPLSPTNVTIESMEFTHFENSKTEALNVALTVSVDNRSVSKEMTFYTSAVLRRSYE